MSSGKSWQYSLAEWSIRNSLRIWRGVAFRKNRIRLDILLLIPAASGVKVKTQNSDLRGEWYEPPNSSPDRVLLYFHGGGYAGGSARSHRAMVSRLAKASGCLTFSAGYRLSHEAPWPAALEDALASYQALRQQHPGKRIFLAGDSAGGGLCLALLHRLNPEDEKPAGLCLFAPWLNLRMDHPETREIQKLDPMLKLEELQLYGECYAGKASIDEPTISPGKAALPEKLPLLIQAGTHDLLYPDIRDWVQEQESQGFHPEFSVWPAMMHVWQAAIFPPESARAIREAGAWIARQS